MSPYACLGPIDPSLVSHSHDYPVSVEDVMAYIDFMRERVGLSDQLALTNGLGNLMNRVDAVTLGSVYRTHSHIRDVAQKIINSRNEPPKSEVQEAIIGALAEKVYAHGHAISAVEAMSIGLPVTMPNPETEKIMWKLLSAYEDHMKMLQPWNPQDVLTGTSPVSDECIVVVIESATTIHESVRTMEIRLRRAIPQNLQVGFSLNINLSEGFEASEEWLERLRPQLQEAARLAVQQALENQAPPTGIEVGARDSGWRQTAL